MKALILLNVDAWSDAPDMGPSNLLRLFNMVSYNPLAITTKIGDNWSRNGSTHGVFSNKLASLGIMPVSPSTDDKVAMKDLFVDNKSTYTCMGK